MKILQTFEDRMHLAMSPQANTQPVTFDPMMIIAIISALIPLLQNCLERRPNALRRRPFNQARLAASIRRESGHNWTEAFLLADKVFDVADESSDAELEEFVQTLREGA